MRILALDASLARASVCVTVDGVVVAEQSIDAARGHAAALPGFVRDGLDAAGCAATDLDAVAVTVGPGSFTGLRAALALAHGIGRAVRRPVVGVTVAEALTEALAGAVPAGRTVWVAIDSRRGRVFLDRPGLALAAFALDALPAPPGPVALAGDASAAVAARLAARGDDAWCSEAILPRARDVATVGVRLLAGPSAPGSAQPIYVDPPEAKLPAGGLRPAPAE